MRTYVILYIMIQLPWFNISLNHANAWFPRKRIGVGQHRWGFGLQKEHGLWTCIDQMISFYESGDVTNQTNPLTLFGANHCGLINFQFDPYRRVWKLEDPSHFGLPQMPWPTKIVPKAVQHLMFSAQCDVVEMAAGDGLNLHSLRRWKGRKWPSGEHSYGNSLL